MELNVLSSSTFGLLEGWWLFEDEEIRIAHSPLLSRDQWKALLKKEGFNRTTIIGCPIEEAESSLFQGIVLGESDGKVIKTASRCKEKTAKADPYLIVLSAKNEDRLNVMVKNLYEYFHRFRVSNFEIPISNLAYTLQAGREAMDHRLALLVHDNDEIRDKLKSILIGQKSIDGFYRGKTDYCRKADDNIEQILTLDKKGMAHDNLEKLANFWVSGGNVDWNLLYKEKLPKRVILPTYPFLKKRFWIPDEKPEGRKYREDRREFFDPLANESPLPLAAKVDAATQLKGAEVTLSQVTPKMTRDSSAFCPKASDKGIEIVDSVIQGCGIAKINLGYRGHEQGWRSKERSKINLQSLHCFPERLGNSKEAANDSVNEDRERTDGRRQTVKTTVSDTYILSTKSVIKRSVHNSSEIALKTPPQSSTDSCNSNGNHQEKDGVFEFADKQTKQSFLDRIQRDLRNIICKQLALEASEFDDEKGFMEYGLDSIFLIEIVREVNDKFSLKLKSALFYEHFSLARLSRYLFDTYPY